MGAAWPELELLDAVDEGNRNEVWLGRLDGERVSVRRSGRSAASLAWELDVLERVTEHGVGVATVIPSDDGRRSVDGVVVQRWIRGRRPDGHVDWQRVADTLAGAHVVPVRQRPGACAVTELTRQNTTLAPSRCRTRGRRSTHGGSSRPTRDAATNCCADRVESAEAQLRSRANMLRRTLPASSRTGSSTNSYVDGHLYDTSRSATWARRSASPGRAGASTMACTR